MDDVALRLQSQLDAQGLSARALSVKAGLSGRHVSKILERGGGGASGETLVKIAAALGVSISWLLTGAGTPGESAPANDRPPVTMGGRDGFSAALASAKLLRPTYPDELWRRVAAGEPLQVVPMSPQLVAEIADVLLRLGPPPTRG